MENFSTIVPISPPSTRIPFYTSSTIYDIEAAQAQTAKTTNELATKIITLQNQVLLLGDRVPPVWANMGVYCLLFVKDACFAVCIVILFFKM